MREEKLAEIHDVAVIGVGGMGSAAAYHLARRGLSVVAIERFSPGHDRGSSHGLSRIIRLAYFEHPSYVPLLRRAFELWRDLESASGEHLMHRTGGLDIGRPGTRVFGGSRASCAVHDLPHEILTAVEVNRRFPGYNLPGDYQAVFQPDGGFLMPEKCITTHVRLAAELGAQVASGRKVVSFSREGSGVVVRLDHGEIRARQIVLCAGAWIPELVPSLASLLRPERQVVAWFGVSEAAAFAPERFPVFVLTTDDGIFYGFPEHDVAGFKIGKYHHRAEPVDPDRAGRAVDAVDESVLRQCVESFFPGANGPMVRSSTCIFTNTPDEHFIIDRLPAMPEALVVSACSGHGFKFCSVIGEVVADLIAEGGTRHDLSLFKLDRFQIGV
jgi:sarcosine oxidase